MAHIYLSYYLLVGNRIIVAYNPFKLLYTDEDTDYTF